MARFPETPSFEHLFDAHITLEPAVAVGAVPAGRRSIIIVSGGTFEGPRLRGRFHAGGGDWLMSYGGGYNELDVRATMETDDGALIYLAYRGVLRADDETMRATLGGENDDASRYYFRTAPRFETGAESYAWLNTTVAIGYGYFGTGIVGYRVFGVL